MAKSRLLLCILSTVSVGSLTRCSRANKTITVDASSNVAGLDGPAAGSGDAASAQSPAAATADVADGMPDTLKELGLFTDGAIEHPEAGVIPFDVKVSLWSDGAKKRRFIHIPSGTTIKYDKTSNRYTFPAGTALIKHFSRDDKNEKPLETRVIVLGDDGTWKFATYQWAAGATKRIKDVTHASGPDAADTDYRIPSQEECKTCHNSGSGNMILGFVPEQLNFAVTDGTTEMQTLIKENLFDGGTDAAMLAVPAKIDPTDATQAFADRVKTYVDLNCGVCHYPGGAQTPVSLSASAIDTAALVKAGYIVPQDLKSSKIWKKFTAAKYRMPPQSQSQDPLGAELLKTWIETWGLAVDAGTGSGSTTDASGSASGSGSGATDMGSGSPTDTSGSSSGSGSGPTDAGSGDTNGSVTDAGSGS